MHGLNKNVLMRQNSQIQQCWRAGECNSTQPVQVSLFLSPKANEDELVWIFKYRLQVFAVEKKKTTHSNSSKGFNLDST